MAYSVEDMATVINTDHARTLRIVIILRWIIFALFHIGGLLIFLLYVWYFEQSPLSLYEKLLKIFQAYSGPKLAGLLSVAGISVLGVAAVYVKIWTKIYAYTVDSFLLREVEAE